MAARPDVSWQPILRLLALITVAALAAITLVWRLSAHDEEAVAAAGCSAHGLVAHVDLVAATGAPRPEQLTQAAGVLRRRLSQYDCGSEVRADQGRLEAVVNRVALAHLDQLIVPGELQFREVLDAEPGDSCVPVARRARIDAELTTCSEDGSERYRLGLAKVVGSDVKSASAQQDQQLGAWQVIIGFTHSGQRRFTDLTTDVLGKRLAIVLDGTVITAPTIQSRISGDAQVTGSFTEDSARVLATLLRYGALPVQLKHA